MFFSSSLQVALGFASVTSITACKGNLIYNIGLKKSRDRAFTTEKTSNFNGKITTTILVFLKHLSQICLSLILIESEKVPINDNLNFYIPYIITYFLIIN